MLIHRSLNRITLMVLTFLLVSCQGRRNKHDFTVIAREIHEKVLTIDTHVDTPLSLDRIDLRDGSTLEERNGKVDLTRMKEGGLDAIFFAVYVAQGPLNEEGYEKVRERAMTLFERIDVALKENSDLAEPATCSADALRIEKLGKRAVYIGIENGYAIGKDLSLIKTYYGMGARYITLCHSRNNDICDSSTDEGPLHHGLSDFGEQVVEEMNRLGIMVDVSHISDESFFDVVEVSGTPVIASHSCTRALCDHPRNLSDEMLLKLKENNGVIQVTLVNSYVKQRDNEEEMQQEYAMLEEKYGDPDTLSPENRELYRKERTEIREKYPREYATVADLVDHIDHVVELIGIDHVGIGSDFDGGGGLKDCSDVSEMGNITEELVKRGYTEEEIGKIWGGNLMRVFREVEKHTIQ